MKKSLQRIFRSQKQRDVSAPHIKQRAKVDAVSIRKENNRMRLFFFKSGDWREQMINEKDTKQICAFTLSGCPRIAPGVKSPEIRRNRVCVCLGWEADRYGLIIQDVTWMIRVPHSVWSISLCRSVCGCRGITGQRKLRCTWTEEAAKVRHGSSGSCKVCTALHT